MTGMIYVLIDPNTHEYRYVGKTTKAASFRLSGHLADAKRGLKSHKNNWIRKLLKSGDVPEIKVITTCESESELNELEKTYIKEFREKGYPLTNGTDGGEGISGWHHSAETRAKLSKAARKRPPISQETRDKKRQSMLGVKHSEEAKKRHSEASSGERNGMYGKTGAQNPRYGKPLSEETKEKISKANKGNPGLRGKENPMYGKFGVLNPNYGRKMSEEQIQKRREINTGRKHTDEEIKKMSDKLKGRQFSLEHRKNLSEAAKEMHRKRREKD